MAHFEEKFPSGEVPHPEFWGGWQIRPHHIEFWQGRANRLHDRVCFDKTHTGWVKRDLSIS